MINTIQKELKNDNIGMYITIENRNFYVNTFNKFIRLPNGNTYYIVTFNFDTIKPFVVLKKLEELHDKEDYVNY